MTIELTADPFDLPPVQEELPQTDKPADKAPQDKAPQEKASPQRLSWPQIFDLMVWVLKKPDYGFASAQDATTQAALELEFTCSWSSIKKAWEDAKRDPEKILAKKTDGSELLDRIASLEKNQEQQVAAIMDLKKEMKTCMICMDGLRTAIDSYKI